MYAVRKDGIDWHLEDQASERLLEPEFLAEGRRPCWTREYGNQVAFIKLFREKGVIGAIRNRLWPRGEKECRTASRLRDLSIPTPRPLGFGKGRMCSFSIQEWVDGTDFLTLFQQFPEKRIDLLRLLTSILLKLKKGMVRHNDLHLRNILVSTDNVPFVIDLHKSKVKRRFTPSDELANVGQALHPIYHEMAEEEKVVFFALYGDPALRVAAEREILRLRNNWVRSKHKRAFKTTSVLLAEGDRVAVRAAATRAEDALIECLKDGAKTRVERHSDHIRKIYRNRRRLKKAWRNHVALEYMGISVAPKPYYVQRAFLTGKSFVAMEDMGPKGEVLSRYLEGSYGTMTSSEARQFMERFSLFLLSLFTRSIAHRDLKPSNIFVLRDGGFRLLDVEDILFQPITPDRLKRMLSQLNELVPGTVGASDRIRFLIAVSRGLPFLTDGARALARFIEKGCRSYGLKRP
jgi:tRNA A-37 threonylcarbamoyl transferase component Bud32